MNTQTTIQHFYANIEYWNCYLQLVKDVKKSKDEIAKGNYKSYTSQELIAEINS